MPRPYGFGLSQRPRDYAVSIPCPCGKEGLAGRSGRSSSRRSRNVSGRSHFRSRSVSRSHFSRSFRSSRFFRGSRLVASSDRQSGNRGSGDQSRANDFGGHGSSPCSNVRGQGTANLAHASYIPTLRESRKGIFHKSVIARTPLCGLFRQIIGKFVNFGPIQSP